MSKLDHLDNCPGCHRELSDGEQIYVCEICGDECCTACSQSTEDHPVVCDQCLT